MKNKILYIFFLSLISLFPLIGQNDRHSDETRSVSNEVIYKIAIYSKSKLKLKQEKYSVLIAPSFVIKKLENGQKYYLYFSGNFKTIKEADNHRIFLEDKGFVSAFIVAFKDKEIISITEALKITER